MATNPRFPNAQEGIAVGLPAPSHAYYNWFRTLNDAVNNGTISVDAANSLITALSARVDALEGGGTADDLLGALYGTNGIGVFGDITSGVEIRGPDLTALRQSIPPGMDGRDGEDSWIPGPMGPQGPAGPAGAPGSGGGGTTIIINEEHYQDAWPIVPQATSSGGGTYTADGTTLQLSGSTFSVKAGGIGPTELAATAVSAGSYTSCDLTVDADGRITAAANGSGGGGGASAGYQVNYARTTVTTNTTYVGSIPYDNTVPQSGEGNEFTGLATTITPTASTSLLEVTVTGQFAQSSGVTAIFALFRDSATSASATTICAPTAGSYPQPLLLRYVVAAGSTSATTFKLRCGGSSSTTLRFNAEGSNAFGTTIPTTMTIKEIKQ